jgi:hypothetical protein
MTSRVLAFDIGIKNLAWCCLEKQGTTTRILGWDNYNLLSESSNVAPTKQTCPSCKAKGVYETQAGLVCSRHCPAEKPALRDLSGNLLKKVPKLALCKELLSARGTKTTLTKANVRQELSKWMSLPQEQAKVSKAPDVGLTEIHNSIQRLVKTQSELWKTCTIILLENQPAFKNPTMKSVQMLLFATLRDLIPSCPPLKLVHAGKKVKGVTTGDEGYKDRKAGSEARAETFLKTAEEKWKTYYQSAAKKSDLADALCMCIDTA